jgi:hypothetical protein
MGLSSWLHRETFPSSILLMSLIGDSLLVYCQDNILYHFLVVPSIENAGYQSPPRLVPFGQISFRGIIHSPSRVRAISWILPEEHTSNYLLITRADQKKRATRQKMLQLRLWFSFLMENFFSFGRLPEPRLL